MLLEVEIRAGELVVPPGRERNHLLPESDKVAGRVAFQHIL
jgi:hypothetical protein